MYRATEAGESVNVTWTAPAEVTGWTENFEAGAPVGWTSNGINNDATSQPTPCYWTVNTYTNAPIQPFGQRHAGLWWSYDHQDEWLVTHQFVCPNANLVYWTYGFQGSTHNDNYYVKISVNNGATWTILQNLSTLPSIGPDPEGNYQFNQYDFPYTISLAQYAGQNVRLAWHAVDGATNDGLWYIWFIDNISVGNVQLRGDELIRVKGGDLNNIVERDVNSMDSEVFSRRNTEIPFAREKVVAQESYSSNRDSIEYIPFPQEDHYYRNLTGFKVYRFLTANEGNQNLWSLLSTINSPTTTNYADAAWVNLAAGTYKYGVKATYSNNSESAAALSNTLTNNFNAAVTINLTAEGGASVLGAQVTLTNNNGNPNFVYSMTAPANGVLLFPIVRRGTYTVSASLEGFENYLNQALSINSAAFSHNIQLAAEPDELPPTNVVAVVNENDEAVISWTAPRDLLDYNVYRFRSHESENPFAWIHLGSTGSPNTTSFTDNQWSALDSGVYQYAVRSVYPENALSVPAFSNTLNHTMTSYVTITVDTNSGDPVLGAILELANIDGNPEHIYSVAVPANGIVVFEEVWKGVYTIEVELSGFNDFSAANLDISNNQFTYDLTLIELLLPAVGLEYELISNNVSLTWLEPGSPLESEQWFDWNEGFYYGSYGTGSTIEFSVAMRFTAQNITDLNIGGLNVTAVQFWPNASETDFTIKIWKGGSSQPWNPGNLVYSQQINNYNNGSWNEFAVTESIEIDSTQELWIGYSVSAESGYPAGFDFGPAVNGYGNLFFFNGQWTTLIDQFPGFNYNWLIKAYAGFDRETSLEIEIPTDNNADRAFLGYMVKRNNTILAEHIQGLSYVDSGVPNGNFVYGVYAQYTSGNSEPITTEEIVILSADEPTQNPQKDGITLLGNYPNPFNPSTEISFSLSYEADVSVEVFNTKGQLITTINKANLSSGLNSLRWDGYDNSGYITGTGVYLYRIKAGNHSVSGKMLMIK